MAFPADHVADIVVGSSSREWAYRSTGEALAAGTAVATTSQQFESHQVSAVLPSVTSVLHVDLMQTCGSKDVLHASLVVLNNHCITHEITAFSSTDASGGRGLCVEHRGLCVDHRGTCVPMLNSAFQHTWLDHCHAIRAPIAIPFRWSWPMPSFKFRVHMGSSCLGTHCQHAQSVPLMLCTWAALVFGCRISRCMKQVKQPQLPTMSLLWACSAVLLMRPQSPRTRASVNLQHCKRYASLPTVDLKTQLLHSHIVAACFKTQRQPFSSSSFKEVQHVYECPPVLN